MPNAAVHERVNDPATCDSNPHVIEGDIIDRDWMMVVESTINFIGDPDSGEATQSEVVGSVFGGGSAIAIIIAAVVIAGAVIIAVKAKKKNKTKTKAQ